MPFALTASAVQTIFKDNIELAVVSRLRYNLQFCSIALLAYDYMLTFADEVQFIWLAKWRLSTVLYFFCRYGLIANISYLLSVSESFQATSRPGVILCGITALMGRFGILAIWGLRTYAAWGMDKRVCAMLLFLGGSAFAAAIVHVCFTAYDPRLNMPELRGTIAIITATFELVAFILATIKVWVSSKEMKEGLISRKDSLQSLIFRQGVVYIFVVLLLSCASMTLNFRVWTRGETSGIIQRLFNCFRLPIPAFMTARFILRLRKWDHHRQQIDSMTTLPAAFARDYSLDADSCSPDRNVSPNSPIKISKEEMSGAWDPRSELILKELSGDIGPTPGEDDMDEVGEKWFKEYEWDWEYMDPAEVDLARRRALMGEDAEPVHVQLPGLRISQGGMSAPADVESGLRSVRSSDHLEASLRGASV